MAVTGMLIAACGIAACSSGPAGRTAGIVPADQPVGKTGDCDSLTTCYTPHQLQVAYGVRPLLDLELRLGEGTGGLLCVPLLRAAANILTDIASLDDVLSGRL